MKNKTFWKKFGIACIPAGIVLVLLLATFLIKGIYPFGSNSIGIIDYGDGLIPSYTYLWDFLHGKAGGFFNYNLGGGANIYASAILNSFLSPLSWLVALFPRANILFGLGFVLIIKLMLMATIAFFVFKKLFKKLPIYIIIIFSVMWALSGYVLVHYTNLGWLDFVMLFPLFALAFWQLLNTGKNLWFVVLLSVMLLYSYYLSYMVLMMIVFFGFFAVLLYVDKEKRKKVCTSILFGVLGAFLISFVAVLPSFLQSSASYRLNEGVSSSVDWSSLTSKLLTILTSALPVVLTVKLCKFFKHDKIARLLLICVLIPVVNIILEPINMMWHSGSYYCFPYRYAFITIFFLICCSLYYLEKYYDPEKIKFGKIASKPVKILLIVVSSLIAILFITLFILSCVSHYYRTVSLTVFISNFVLFLAFALMMCFALSLKKQLTRRIVLSCFIGVELITYLIAFFPLNFAYTNCQHILDTYQLKNELSINELDNNYRLKDMSNNLGDNYALLMDFPTISTWIHINNAEERNFHSNLGYNVAQTPIGDYGGTYFSDCLLGVKYCLSTTELNADLYTLLDSTEIEYSDDLTLTYYLYETKYTASQVVTINNNLTFDYGSNPIESQNILFQSLTNSEDKLLNDFTVNYTSSEEADEKRPEIVYYCYTYNINVEAGQYLYGLNNTSSLKNVLINGEEVASSLNNNTLLNLGYYETAQSVSVTIKTTTKTDKAISSFATADIETLITGCQAINNNDDVVVNHKNNSLSFNLEVVEDCSVFIPVNYLNGGWKCTINGETVDVKETVGCFIAIELKSGDNKVELNYTPKAFSISLIISLAALAIVVVCFVINKYKNWLKNKVVYFIGYALSIAITAMLTFYVYIWSFIKLII